MTAPHYGKRNLGAGTAASPGDTLYFFFGTYNDSGNSETDTGFSVTDIEVYKDNGTTPRLTDSGYALILDTGTPGLRRFSVQIFNTADDATFYANGSWYQVAVDNIKIDGKLVRFWAGSFELGEPRANVVAFADTGVNDRLARIQSDVDTGLRDTLADYDTGIRDFITDAKNELDTGGVAATVDTGVINQAVWQGNGARSVTDVTGFSDTGINDRLARIGADADTGLRAQISDVDTGIHDAIADLDTGVRGILQTTGVTVVAISDTGVNDRLARILADTDTGIQSSVNVTGFADTGVNDRLGKIGFDVDTGLRDVIAALDTGLRDFIDDADTGIVAGVWAAASRTLTEISDTGINQRLGAIETKTGSLTFTVAGFVDANIQYVNDVQITGVGDTGTGNTWRPA